MNTAHQDLRHRSLRVVATTRLVTHQSLNISEALKRNKQNKMAFYELMFNEFNCAKEIARYVDDSRTRHNRQ